MGEARAMTEYQIYKRHKRLCRYKIAYAIEADAQEALVATQSRPDAYLPEELRIYVCKCCGFMHIGHAPKWKDDGKREPERSGRGQELLAARLAAQRANPVLSEELKSQGTGIGA